MSFAVTALLPIFLTIMVGFGVKQSGLINEDHWDSIDRLAYYVLFPAMVFQSITTADFTGVPVWRMAAAIILGLATMHVLLLVLRRAVQNILNIDGPGFTSVFQGAGRWHTFIGLALMPALFGQPGLALGALAAAAVIPLSNFSSVAVLTAYASHTKLRWTAVGLALIRNPFVLSCSFALLAKAIGLQLPGTIIQVLELIGRAALGVALLSVGAGLRLNYVTDTKAATIVATVLKLLILPVFMWIWTEILGVDGLARAVAILAGSVPTSAAAYILARQLGGDGPLMANIMTFQVICAAITLPFIISWVSP